MWYWIAFYLGDAHASSLRYDSADAAWNHARKFSETCAENNVECYVRVVKL